MALCALCDSPTGDRRWCYDRALSCASRSSAAAASAGTSADGSPRAGADVTFLARGAHLEAMRTRGLRIDSPKGNVHLPQVKAAADPSEVGPADIVLFAVKLYDTESALGLLPPLVGPGTVVIPLQNGVDSVAMLTRAVGAPHTAGGTCYVSAVIAEPGVIRHTAMDHLIFGELDGSRSARLEWLLEACRPAGFQATLSTDITVDIWTKFVRLSVFSGMTAVTRSPLGVVVRRPAALRDVQRRGARSDGGRPRERHRGAGVQRRRRRGGRPARCRRKRNRRCSRISSAGAASSCRG